MHLFRKNSRELLAVDFARSTLLGGRCHGARRRTLRNRVVHEHGVVRDNSACFYIISLLFFVISSPALCCSFSRQCEPRCCKNVDPRNGCVIEGIAKGVCYTIAGRVSQISRAGDSTRERGGRSGSFRAVTYRSTVPGAARAPLEQQWTGSRACTMRTSTSSAYRSRWGICTHNAVAFGSVPRLAHAFESYDSTKRWIYIVKHFGQIMFFLTE